MFDSKPQQDHSFSETNSDTRLSENENNCISSPSDDDILQFRPNSKTHQESDDSGVCSPPLWKNSPSPSPPRSPSHPLLSHQYCLSPNSRKNAIARGQRELMEMVKSMPESSYELSLKDIVEHRDMEIGKNQILNKGTVFVKVKRRGSKKNGSFEDKGVFLKMGFLPFHLQSKKSKRFGDGDKGSEKGSSKTDIDWWKKKFTGSSDSDQSRSSSNTSSHGGGGSSSSSRSCGGQRKNHGFVKACSCCPFFKSKVTTKSI